MYASVVATFAALASIGSLLLHWLRWRHDQRTKSLIVRAIVQQEDEEDVSEGWRTLTVTFRSRADTGYKGEYVRVLWPPSGRIARWQDCMIEDPDSPYNEARFKPPEQARRAVSMSLAVVHAGQSRKFHPQAGYRMAFGDTESESFFIKRRGSGRVVFAIRIQPEDDLDRPFIRRKWVEI